jgi:hypothetical protein
MIDRLVASIANAEAEFPLLFSAAPFPGYTVELKWRHEEYSGNRYYSPPIRYGGLDVSSLAQILRKALPELSVRAEAKSEWKRPPKEHNKI